MDICNGEPFIKLETAVKAYFGVELLVDDISEKHFEFIECYLDSYVYVFGVCDVYTPANPSEECKVVRFPKLMNGMAKVKIDPEPFTPENGQGYTLERRVSPFMDNISPDLVGCYIQPINDSFKNGDNLKRCYVRLSEYINHAKNTGIQIDVLFLGELIINDDSFGHLKRLSKKTYEGQFDLKQAANKYLKYFDGVLEQTIIQACEYASDTYDQQERSNNLEQVNTSNVNDILKIINDTPPTVQNIEQLKRELPDDWREALFVNLSETFISPTSDNIDKNSFSSKEQENLYKTIGLLTKAFVNKNGTNFGSVENPNANKIREHLDQFLPKEPVGLSDRAIRERIKKGINSLKEC